MNVHGQTWITVSLLVFSEIYDRLGCFNTIFTNLKKRFGHIELPAKMLDYFLRSNTSNINQSVQCGRWHMPPCRAFYNTVGHHIGLTYQSFCHHRPNPPKGPLLRLHGGVYRSGCRGSPTELLITRALVLATCPHHRQLAWGL